MTRRHFLGVLAAAPALAREAPVIRTVEIFPVSFFRITNLTDPMSTWFPLRNAFSDSSSPPSRILQPKAGRATPDGRSGPCRLWNSSRRASTNRYALRRLLRAATHIGLAPWQPRKVSTARSRALQQKRDALIPFLPGKLRRSGTEGLNSRLLDAARHESPNFSRGGSDNRAP